MSGWNYDVFLSFRGEDTRNNFTGHLYTALDRVGIRTFRDDDELERGEDIGSELVMAIEESRIAIVVFSRNYASSRWCLDELVKILDCKNRMGQKLVPVFYDADPSDVRKQTGSFAEAFAKHEERFKTDMEKVDKWRAALTEAANLSGWDLRNVADGHESKFIQQIVEQVLTIVNQTHLNVAVYPVGLDSRIQSMNFLLRTGLISDVRVVGICGMGGIGKTTIAKAVYNLIYRQFDGSSFLENVRETSEQQNGLVRLQQRLLSDVLIKKNLAISNVSRGIEVIKQRLCCKRVLIVLDDVDKLNQLHALAVRPVCFGVGSRIIITTRDESLLRLLEVDEIYNAKELNHKESLQLFSWHAFKKDCPIKGYVELSNEVVSNVGGVPLALEVWGSFLFDKRSIPEWKSALDKLRRIPHDQIQEKLKISFDSLDDAQKDVFLDIACFFIGIDKGDAFRILDGCGFSSVIEITVLVRRSLVTITRNNELRMHDLLRDMGREVVRKESPKIPGKRSRLWFIDDVYEVLLKYMGTEAVEGLILNLYGGKKENFKTETFVKMHKLRLLQINHVQLTGDYEHLPKDLRWLCWHGFPLKSIPYNFHLENLVVLDMQYSNVTQIWKEIKFMEKLQVLNLSNSYYLTKTPNFLGLANLEQLMLEGCSSLVEVHPSIGKLDKLVILNLKDCRNLKNLPSSFCNLTSLENLVLSGCSKLDMLPEELGNMKHLVELLADGTAITQLPFSIGHLKNLRKLSLEGCKGLPSKSWFSTIFCSFGSARRVHDSITLLPTSFSNLCSLRSLNLNDCNLSEGAIPVDFGSLSLLQELDLGHNNFCSLPASIGHLSHLQVLRLHNCTRLQSLPELPSNLETLYANNCTSIENLSNFENLSSLRYLNFSSNNFSTLPSSISRLPHLRILCINKCKELQSLPELPSSLEKLEADSCTSIERLSFASNLQNMLSLQLRNWEKIVEIQGMEKLESTRFVHLEGCNSLANTFRESLLKGLSYGRECNIFLPGSEIPEWFSHQSNGSSVSFEVHPLSNVDQIQELAVCVVYAADEQIYEQVVTKTKKEADELLLALPTDLYAHGPVVNITNTTNGLDWIYNPTNNLIPLSSENHLWVGHIPRTEFGKWLVLESGDQVEVSIEIDEKIQLKKCGVHLVYPPDEKNDQESMECTTFSYEDGSIRGTKRSRDGDDEAGPSSSCSYDDQRLKHPRT